MNNNNSDLYIRNLRSKAEEILQEQENSAPETREELSPERFRAIIHELNIHQVELEIQNEQLRQAQKELELARIRYYELYDLAPVGYLTLDEKGIIQETNLTAAHLFERGKEKILKQPLTHFITPDDQDIHYLSFKELEKTGEQKVYELRMLNKEGSPFWVQVEMTKAQDPESGENIYRTVIIDITERKQAENTVKTNLEHKEDKLESLGILAGGIAHDFNNHLATLQGNLSLVKSYKNRPDMLEEKIQNMETVVQRAKELNDHLFEFATGGTADNKVISIKNLIKETTRYILSSSSRVSCSLAIPKNLWEVKIDEEQITQVLYNIINNAAQSMTEGGVISVSAENVTLESEKEDFIPLPAGKYVKISIKDEGPGIQEKNLQKIFDPFYTAKVEGSGMGLATSYSIVKKHNGYIQVKSELGKGSTFNVFLPAHM